MWEAILEWFYGSGHATKYTKRDGAYTIKYTNGNITVTKNNNHVLTYKPEGFLEYEDTIYEFNEDRSIRSLCYCGKVIHSHRIGSDLEGNIMIDGDVIEYHQGMIQSATVDNNLYRKVQHSEYPFYLVYTGSGIYGYVQGVWLFIVSGKSRYALVAGGNILGYMSNLDTNVHVQWKHNISSLLSHIKGYNPCDKKNLLPKHYFNDDIWCLLSKHNIIVPYNKNLVEHGSENKHFIDRTLFLSYDDNNSIIDAFGQQPLLSIVQGNLHGLISLNSDYYYYQGILQWRRDGTIYIVRYSDDHLVKMSIYADRVIYNNKNYFFSKGCLTINDDINLTIVYNKGIPMMTTHGKKRNIIPEL